MAKYTIEVEIPDGPYCLITNNPSSFCQYTGDAHYGAGCCNLIPEGDSIIYWEGEEKYEKIVKHTKCPSLLIRRTK